DDLVADVVLRPVEVPRRAAEAPEENRHARQAELVAQTVDGRRDQTEILGDERELPDLLFDRAEQLDARPGPPPATLRSLVMRGNRPVGDEAAEVVDAAGVDELERAAEPF